MGTFKYSRRKKVIISSLREKRKKKRIFFIILFFCLIVLSGYFFIFSPFFKINKIEISGEKTLNKEEILAFVNEFLSNGRIYKIFPKNNIFIFNSEDFFSDFQNKFPIVKKVDISKKIPRYFNILIEEREPIGIWCAPSRHIENFFYGEISQRISDLADNIFNKCFYVDFDGVIFTEAPVSSGGLILNFKDLGGENAKLGDTVFSVEFLKTADTLRESFFNNFNVKITEFRIYPEGSFKLEVLTSDGWSVIFDPRLELSKSLIKLSSILNEEIKEKRLNLEYIDLRIGNKVYYKYKNGL